MKREKFNILESTCVPLPLTNIDTDQIIPARFLSATSKEGFGKNLFRDWRYDKEGNEIPDFILNRPVYRGTILITGSNFGCGSSREHAVWAIRDHGFRAVVSDSFADIFRNNALNNGLLPVQIPSTALIELTKQIILNPGTIVKIDLERQLISSEETGLSAPFSINAFRKQCLLSGLDNIDFLLEMKEEIIAFEQSRSL
ncbi:MAG: 3-isopropylmalate dehydratase small subunit [Bacteroidales bacterium]|jgi:3-isopropylmalate/(R)-2-methylmalate dehydratase small subunit|nr:3-isopropylmalate dehydratase small subunit [Bacteroidales bacterium]